MKGSRSRGRDLAPEEGVSALRRCSRRIGEPKGGRRGSGFKPEGVYFVDSVVENEGNRMPVGLHGQHFGLHFVHPRGEVGLPLAGSDHEDNGDAVLPLVEYHHCEQREL
jgi:hypothetical protein